MTKPISVRRREQRDRQKAYRDQQRNLKRPSRDDMARVVFWAVLRAHILTKREDKLDGINDLLVEQLGNQGFDPRQIDLAFEEIVDRYSASSTPPFRRKVHLR